MIPMPGDGKQAKGVSVLQMTQNFERPHLVQDFGTSKSPNSTRLRDDH